MEGLLHQLLFFVFYGWTENKKYTSAHNMWNKQEDLEIYVWLQGHDIIAVMKAW